MNFQDIYKKIKAIDEGQQSVEECGEMVSMMGGAHPVPPQQDNISMNVSMNAQGTGGIRDLMSVLQAIEQGTDGDEGGEVIIHGSDDEGGDDFTSALDSLVGGEKEVELGDKMADENTGMDMVPDDPNVNTGAPAENPEGGSDEEQVASEEFKNEPGETYQSADYMTQTLAGGSDEPQHMKKHGYRNADNPLGMKESLISDLASLYEEIKLREGDKKKTMSRAAKGNEKYGKDGMKALAKAGREGASEEKLDKIRDKYDNYNESAKWRDPKHKDKLYTQEPRGDDDYGTDDDYYNPKPDDYPGAKHLKGGGEFDHNDPLRKGYGRYGTGSMNTHGKRKGLPSRDQIRSLKGSIKDAHGKHPAPNLPEQVNESKELNDIITLTKMLKG